MRCEIDRGIFAELLAGVTNALPSKSAYPVLNNITLDVNNGKLALAGTDLDTYVRRTFALEGQSEDGTVVVLGRKLAEIVREINAPTIKLSSKERSLSLEAGRVKASLVSLDPSEFPEVPKLPEGVTMEFPLSTWFELFETVSFAASKDESRPAMTGVNWEVSKTETRMVGTDGHRLAYICRKGKFAGKIKMIVSPKVFPLFPRGEEMFTVHMDPAKVGFVFQNATIITRQIEGPYPDYERVIPKGYPARALIEHEVFSAALRRAAVFAHPVGRLVALDFAKGKLGLKAETPDVGRSEEEVECGYTGEPVRIGFNASYMLEILRRLQSEKVAVELSNPLSAGLFKPVDDKPDTEQTFLLMPIRLD
jgi:DNA polymerase III subunit beta